MNSDKKVLWLSYFILLLLILIRSIPFIYPQSRTWGFNHLLFLPDIFSVVFFIMAGIALILPFVKSSEKWGTGLAEWFSSTFVNGRYRYISRLIFVVIMAAMFAIFRTPTHFLGDGYDVINNVAAQTGVHVKWSEIGITKLMVALKSLFDSFTVESSRLAFQTVSIASGAATVWFFFLISGVATDDKLKRTLIFITSLFSGSVLLFFGYAEYYPPLWPLMLGHIYFCMKFLKTGEGLAAVWIFLMIGTVLHIQMAIFIPAAVYVSLVQGRGRTYYDHHRLSTRILSGAIAIGLIVIIIHKYTTDLYFEDMFLPLLSGKPIDPGYAIFSTKHLLDIFNEMILISPFFFLFAIIVGRDIKSTVRERARVYLGLASVGFFLFLFTIDPKLAMPRDWDLFSMTPFVPTILLIMLVSVKTAAGFKRLLVSLIIILFISPLPYLLVNLNRERSVEYFEFIIRQDAEKGLSSFVVLYGYAREHNITGMADSLGKVYSTTYADWQISADALKALDNGNIRLGETLFGQMKPNRFDAEYHRIKSRIHFMRGEMDKALEHIDKAIRLRRFYFEYYCERGRIYTAMGHPQKFIDDFREAYQIQNSSSLVLNGLAFMFTHLKQYDSAIYYGEKLVAQDTTVAQVNYSLAKSYAMVGERDKARKYAVRFGLSAEKDSTLIGKWNELMQLIGDLRGIDSNNQ